MIKILVDWEFPLPIISRFRILIEKINNTPTERTPNGHSWNNLSHRTNNSIGFITQIIKQIYISSY